MSQKAGTQKVSAGKRVVGIIGGLAFAIGFILAIIGGVVAHDSGGIVLALVILGIVVSILNITAKEAVPIMVAAIALIVGASVKAFTPLNDIAGGFGDGLNWIVHYLAVFMVPVAVISAVRAVIAMGRPGD